MTGEVLKGPMKGRKLPALDDNCRTKQVRWDEWLKQHPTTLVLMDPKVPRLEPPKLTVP